jgi:16S rRNA (guanine966-N2)-methyltransferase
MRIVAGRFGGARLASPKSNIARPTSDKVRQAVFNVLAHGLEGFELDNVRALDLFAGTGAMGLEALSRGARYCLFIEQNAEVRATLRRNVEELGLTGATKIWRRDVTKLGPAGRLGAFGLIILDPPYGKGLGQLALASALEGGWIEPGGICVLEEAASADIDLPQGFELLDQRRYGDTQVVFLQSP